MDEKKNNKLLDFGNEVEGSFLDEPIKTLVAFKDQLSKEQTHKLLPLLYLLPQPEIEQIYGPEFDVAAEIDRMIRATRAMQDHIMEDGRIKVDTPLREVKEATTAANTMITSLMKHHSEVVNLGRMQATEKATIKVLKEMGKSEEFFAALEIELEAIK